MKRIKGMAYNPGNEEKPLTNQNPGKEEKPLTNPVAISTTTIDRVASSSVVDEVPSYTALEEPPTPNNAHTCGWFGFKPKIIQRFNSAVWFTVTITLINVFQSGTTNGLVGAVQSSIEVRYQLTSKQSSWIVIAYEIATIPLCVWVMFVGTVGVHRPRWTTAFLMVSVLGCLLYASPQFFSDVYAPARGNATGGSLMCSSNVTICETVTSGRSTLYVYVILLLLGRIALAFGGTALYTFPVTFIDDSVTRDKFSLYMSFFALGGVVGPAVGFIVGGYLLNVHTDFLRIETSDLPVGFDSRDPRWVGAWWLGFVVAAVGLFFTTLPISGYPKDLPGAEQARTKKVNEASGLNSDPTITRLHVDFGMKDIPRYTKDVLKNGSFMSLMFFLCCDVLVLSGFTVFGPKYMEVAFGLTAANAGMIFGILVVPAGVIGSIAGGLMIERLKLNLQGIVKLQFIVTVLVFFTAFGIFSFTCEQKKFAGVNVDYVPDRAANSTYLLQPLLTSSCNEPCGCSDIRFEPVCENGHMQYYSACHAGCVDEGEFNGTMVFYNCSCASDPRGFLSKGTCSNDACNKQMYLFGGFLFVAMVSLFLCDAMNISTTIRVVPNSHRLFAMLFEDLIVRFLGSLPGPILFGVAFDAACVLWQHTCDDSGYCFYYDTSKLAMNMLITTGTIRLVASICMFFAWWLYRSPIVVETLNFDVSLEEINKVLGEQEVEPCKDTDQQPLRTSSV